MDWSTHYPAFIDSNRPATIDRPAQLTKDVTVADIGCGFGGLLIALSPLLPDELILGMSPPPPILSNPIQSTHFSTAQNSGTQLATLAGSANMFRFARKSPGLEIRTQVTQYVTDRIRALRSTGTTSSTLTSSPSTTTTTTTTYQNISALRANTMKFLPNLFTHAQLTNIFLCFPDPHFKARKHKARIVSSTLCAEYAYVLRPGGLVWTITDVEELSGWMVRRFEDFGKANQGLINGEGEGDEDEEAGGTSVVQDPVRNSSSSSGIQTQSLFTRIPIPLPGDESTWPDQQVGQLVKCIREETEEGKKVTRNGGVKYVAVFRRGKDPAWPSSSP